MDQIFSADNIKWAIAFLVPVGIGVIALREYKIAKICFGVSALVLFGRAIMWARVTNISFWGRAAICLIIFGAIGLAIVESMRWIDRKKLESEPPPSQASTKEEPPPAHSPIVTPKPEKAQPETKQTPQPSPTSPPSAQKKLNDADAGLTFREVPPESLGFKRTVPDSFTIEFGTNKGTFPTELLKKQVPFERLIGIKAGGDLPLKVYFDKDGDMKIDATIYESRGKVAAVIKASNFAVINSAWDRNWDSTAFEIVDESQNTIFQIERL